MNTSLTLEDRNAQLFLSRLPKGSSVEKTAYSTIYLKTDWFAKLRQQAYVEHNGICHVCGRHVDRNHFNAHHLTYYDNRGSILFREDPKRHIAIVHPGRCHDMADRERRELKLRK